MKVSNNFYIWEFVPPEVYNRFYESSTWFIDPACIKIAQFLRELGDKPLSINTWKDGGAFKESGFRLPDSKTGGKLSQHKFGRAIDLKGENIEALYQWILGNQAKAYELGIRCVEDFSVTKTWLHIDVRDTGESYQGIIKVVRP